MLACWVCLPAERCKVVWSPPVFHCMCRVTLMWLARDYIMLYKLLLNLLAPISGLTRFASIAKRFYHELSQRIITNDDVIRRQPMTGDSGCERLLWTASWVLSDLKSCLGGHRQDKKCVVVLLGSNKTCYSVESSSCRQLGLLRGPAKLKSTSQRRWPFARRLEDRFWSFSPVRRVSGQPTDSHRRRSSTCNVRRCLDRRRHHDITSTVSPWPHIACTTTSICLVCWLPLALWAINEGASLYIVQLND